VSGRSAVLKSPVRGPKKGQEFRNHFWMGRVHRAKSEETEDQTDIIKIVIS
jgi:hypothetical protein